MPTVRLLPKSEWRPSVPLTAPTDEEIEEAAEEGDEAEDATEEESAKPVSILQDEGRAEPAAEAGLSLVLNID